MLRSIFRSNEVRSKRNALAKESSNEPDFSLNTSLSTLQALLVGDKHRARDNMGAANSTETVTTQRKPFGDRTNNALLFSDKPPIKKQSSRPKIMLPRKSSKPQMLGESLPRVPVSVSIKLQPGCGIGLRCNSHDQASLGIKVEVVDANGPCAGKIFSQDRIVKVGDLYIDRMPLQVGLWTLEKHLRTNPTSVAIMVSREAPMLKKCKIKTRHIVKKSLQRRDIVHQVALKAPMLQTIEEQPEVGTKSPIPHTTTTTTTKTTAVTSTTTRSAARSISISTTRPTNATMNGPSMPSSMAKFHRLNKVLKASMEHDRLTMQRPQQPEPQHSAPIYPDSHNMSELRRSVAIDELSVIQQPDDYRPTPEPNPAQPQMFCIYFGKNTRSLGIRIIGAKKRSGQDKGIFVGKPLASYPENRQPQFLELGDQIIKVNDVALRGIPNAVAAKSIKDHLMGPNSVKLTLLRYPRETAASTPTPY